MKKVKSLIAIILVFVLAVSNLPMQALAVSSMYNGYEECEHEWIVEDCETPATCYICGATDSKAPGHIWQEASCDAPKHCPICGIGEGMPLGHDLGEWITIKEVSCTTDGENRLLCSRCSYYEREIIPKGHRYIDIVTEPTCTEKGYTTYTCEVCGDSSVGAWVKEKGHSWQEVSCEEAKHCPICGIAEGMPLGHDMGDWVTLNEPTCTKEGKLRRDCSRCNDYEIETFPANGHVYEVLVTEVTCTQKGYTIYTCSICDYNYIGDYVTAPGHAWQEASCDAPKHCPACGSFEGLPLGHNMSDWTTLSEATCSKDGKMRRSCSRCDYYEVEVIPANGHNEVVDQAVAATCTTAGKTKGKHCDICGTVILVQKTISAKGHDWKAGNCTTPETCKTCGTTIGGAVHTYTHQYDYKCDACNAVRTVDMTRPMMNMYRMYDPNSGEHFYTGSEEEKNNLVAVGWHYEGVGFTFPLTTGDPVHRLYDPATGEHLYTVDKDEMNKLLAQGWNYEGIAFNSGFENEVPQYRLHNPNASRGAYHFTASDVERDNLIAAGWEYQGIGWYSLGA